MNTISSLAGDSLFAGGIYSEIRLWSCLNVQMGELLNALNIKSEGGVNIIVFGD